MKKIIKLKYLLLVLLMLCTSIVGLAQKAKKSVKKPLIVFVTGDHEYSGESTLPKIAAELEKTSTTGVLVLASYKDFYKFPVYNYLRDILGTRLAYHGEIAVEYGYDEVLTQASLGEESFLRFPSS